MHREGESRRGTLLCRGLNTCGKTDFQFVSSGGLIQVSNGTSSSEVVSSDKGMSSTSSSEEEEEKEGEVERGIELVEEGEARNRDMLRPSV